MIKNYIGSTILVLISAAQKPSSVGSRTSSTKQVMWVGCVVDLSLLFILDVFQCSSVWDRSTMRTLTKGDVWVSWLSSAKHQRLSSSQRTSLQADKTCCKAVTGCWLSLSEKPYAKTFTWFLFWKQNPKRPFTWSVEIISLSGITRDPKHPSEMCGSVRWMCGSVIWQPEMWDLIRTHFFNLQPAVPQSQTAMALSRNGCSKQILLVSSQQLSLKYHL